MRLLSLVASLVLLMNLVAAQQSPKTSSLDELQFLIGEWEGVGEGGPGAGKGVFSFEFDLAKQGDRAKEFR